MTNNIYFVPREETTNNNNNDTTDNSLLALENRVNPLRDRLWNGEAVTIGEPFTPELKLDRNLNSRLYLGVKVIVVDDPIAIDASSLNVVYRPRPDNYSQTGEIESPTALDTSNLILRS